MRRRLAFALSMLLATSAPGLARADSAAPEFRHADPSVRALAARTAGAKGRGQATPSLIELLEDPAPMVRREAARALGLLRARQAARPLAVVAQTDLDPLVRHIASEALRRIDPRGYVAMISAANPLLPRDRAAAGTPPSPRGRPAFLFALGLGVNARRPADTVAGELGLGLRWPWVETQLSLGFPDMTLFGQVRLNLPISPRVVPYVTGGAALVFNNRSKLLPGPSVAFALGAGLRARLPASFYLYLEALASYTVLEPTPAQDHASTPSFTLSGTRLRIPLFLGLGYEL